MARVRRAKLPQTQWEKHKSMIKQLYLEEKRSLEGNSGVMELMECHGFYASKPQYETQFKRWGFRKKLTREAWHIIGHVLAHRQSMGLVSNVYLFGERLASGKVKKDTARHKICAVDSQNCSTAILPDGVVIRGAPCQTAEGPIDENNADENSSLRSSPESERLEDIELLSPASGPGSHVSVFPSAGLLDLSKIPSALQTMPSDLDTEIFHIISPKDSDPELWEIVTGFDNGDTPCNTLILFEGLQNPLLEQIAVLCDAGGRTVDIPTYGAARMKGVDPCIGRAMPLLPWRAQYDLQKQTFEIVLFRQIMFLLMNNFAGSDYDSFEALFQRLGEFSVSQLEDILDAIPLPYSTALQQSVLTIAIKSDVPAIVRILLDRGLDVDRVTCRFAGTSYTPLGLACKFRHMNIIKLLVDHGVDVNQRDHQTTCTAMWYLLGVDISDLARGAELPPVVCDILRLLLMARAHVGWNELENPHFWTNTPLLDVYIRYTRTPVRFEYGYQLCRPLINATQLVEDQKATRAVRVMLGKDFRAGPHLDPAIKARWMEAFEGASLQGNVGLVDYFLSCGFQPTVKCLSQAVRGNSLAAIKRFIAARVDLDLVLTPNYHIPEFSRPYAGSLADDVDPLLRDGIMIRYVTLTPYAEAIRWSRDPLIELFHEHDILKTITETSKFTAALVAAAEAGNAPMVRTLLSLAQGHPELFVPGLSVSLSLATLGGHADIVMMLMDAGIRPTCTSLMAAVVVHNAEMVRLFLDTGISLDIPGLLWFAVRWGQFQVLQDLMTAGAAVNEYGWHLGFMETELLKRDVVRSPLGEEIHRGDAQVMQLLLDRGANVSMEVRTGLSGHKGLSPLAAAVQSGQRALITQLLEQGADPDDPVALLIAASQSLILTQTLLDAFTRRYPEGKRYFASKALRCAIRGSNAKLVDMLASYTDPNDLEQRREEPDEVAARIGRSLEYLPSPLGEAIVGGNANIVETLLRNRGNPHSIVATQVPSPHTGRWTAILQAIASGDLAIVKLIRDAGAEVNCSTELGLTRTPLQLAIDLGNHDIVQFLLEEGADVNAPPCIWGGGTALQLAAIKGNVGVAELLIQRYADINAPRSQFQGRTAFEGAAEHGRMDMLLLLYHKGVDIVSDGGEQVRRAVHFAEKNGQLAAKILVERLAEKARLNAILLM